MLTKAKCLWISQVEKLEKSYEPVPGMLASLQLWFSLNAFRLNQKCNLRK